MPTTAISRRLPPVAVTYILGNVRVRKVFPDAHKAKRFYGEKLAAGAQPKVQKILEIGQYPKPAGELPVGKHNKAPKNTQPPTTGKTSPSLQGDRAMSTTTTTEATKATKPAKAAKAAKATPAPVRPKVEKATKPAKAEKATKAKAKATKAEKPAKGEKAKAPRAGKRDGKTERLLAFEALKGGKELTAKQLCEAAGLPKPRPFLKDECFAAKPRLHYEKYEGERGGYYKLTAAGEKALKDGTVDSEAAPSAVGKKQAEA